MHYNAIILLDAATNTPKRLPNHMNIRECRIYVFISHRYRIDSLCIKRWLAQMQYFIESRCTSCIRNCYFDFILFIFIFWIVGWLWAIRMLIFSSRITHRVVFTVEDYRFVFQMSTMSPTLQTHMNMMLIKYVFCIV